MLSKILVLKKKIFQKIFIFKEIEIFILKKLGLRKNKNQYHNIDME